MNLRPDRSNSSARVDALARAHSAAPFVSPFALRLALQFALQFVSAFSSLVALILAGAPETARAQVVIRQIYGANGNAYRQDYVELFNRGTSAVSISGWTLQYASATGTVWASTW